MIYCDICELEGEEEVPAVAKYEADNLVMYAVCEKHLEIVKANNLEYRKIE